MKGVEGAWAPAAGGNLVSFYGGEVERKQSIPRPIPNGEGLVKGSGHPPPEKRTAEGRKKGGQLSLVIGKGGRLRDQARNDGLKKQGNKCGNTSQESPRRFSGGGSRLMLESIAMFGEILLTASIYLNHLRRGKRVFKFLEPT